MIWGPIALTAAMSAMLGASLAPALTELRRRKDAAPLPTRGDDSHITNFATGFRRRLHPLGDHILRCRQKQTSLLVPFEDGTDALVVGGDCPNEIPKDVSAVVLCAQSASLPSATEWLCDVFANGDFIANAGTTLRALLAEGDAWLGESCTVCRWLHSEGKVRIASGSSLFGRLSSEKEVVLAPFCRFERVYAPVILFGCASLTKPVFEPSQRLDIPSRSFSTIFKKRSIVDVKLGRLLAHGDFHLASGDVLQGHVVVAGNVLIDGGSRILGSVKSHGRTDIGRNVEIHGSVVSSASLHIGGESYLRGPVLAEGDLEIGPGTVIGTPESPTTVSAPRIRVSPDSVIHGTIWARYEGYVESE